MPVGTTLCSTPDVGTPLAFDVEDPRTSAFEYLLGAVGADLVAGMKQLCHRRRLEEHAHRAQFQLAMAYFQQMRGLRLEDLAHLTDSLTLDRLHPQTQQLVIEDLAFLERRRKKG